MKILHIQLLPLLSGVQRVSLNEMISLKSEFEYKLLCASNGPLTEHLDRNDIESFLIPELCRNIDVKKDFLAFFKILKFIRNENFDIVHTHSSKTGVLGRIAAKLAGVRKVVHTVHGFSFPAAETKSSYYLFFFLEWFAKFFTDILIVLNESDKNIAIKKLGYNKKRIRIIPNGVDINKFKPHEKESNKASLKIIMVGRLWRQKDPNTLLKAVLHLLDHNYDVKLTFVGDGDLRADMEKIAANYADSITFYGWSDNISEILVQHDIFVLPSLWEGMPLAILEALSCGVPCVVSDIPGNNDLITEDFNGSLFSPGDTESLIKKIISYITEPERLSKQSIASRSFIENGYSLELRNNTIKTIYKE